MMPATEIPVIPCRLSPFCTLYVSKIIVKMWGINADTLMQEPERIMEIVYEKDRAAFIEKAIENPFRNGYESIEFRVVMPDDSKRWYALRLHPVQINPQENEAAGFLEDITERKPREVTLQATYDKLEDCIHIVKHDVKGVVGNIIFITHLIKQKIDGQEQVAAYLDMITAMCRDCTSLADSLFNTFFAATEDFPLNKEETDIVEEVTCVVDMHQPQLANKKLELNIIALKEKIPVSVDRIKFRQVVKNLVSNAIKFSHEKGHIAVILKELEDAVLLEIHDAGIGIPPACHPFLFNKHSKAMRTGTKGEKPTGLGTYIVKKMVEAHSGEVWFESEENVGTTFYVSIPRE